MVLVISWHPQKNSDNIREITIKDDDPTLTISSISKAEGSGGTNVMQFEVEISVAPSLEVRVTYATSGGSALQGADFTAATGILIFPARETTSQLIDVIIDTDSIDENDEEFNITLSNPTGGAKIGGTGIAVGTIEDDDDTPILSIDSVEITEGQAGEKDMTFTASLTRVSSRNVTFEYSTTGITATAGEDFVSVQDKEATILAGTTSLPINIKINGDSTDESDETFTIALAIAVNATISASAGIGQGTIISDDKPAFHVVNTGGLEDPDGKIVFEVTLSPAHSAPASVRFTTVSGATDSATIGVDFEAVDEILNFDAGERSKLVTVVLKSDELDEDDEEFTVRLITQSGGTTIVGNGLAKGQIIDNDGEIFMSISDAEIIEGNTGETMMEFTVSLDSPSGRDVSVRYNTTDLTSDGVASFETDYVPIIDGVLIFLPGITERTISISILGDDEFEPDEAYYIVLSEAINATITRNVGIGTILNDDPEIPRLNLEHGQKTVYNEGEVVEIELETLLFHSAASDIELPITITQNGDFIRWRNTNVITIDSAQKMIRIPTHDDSIVEESGSITVSIEKEENVYTVNPVRSSVTVSILDNDGINTAPQPRIGIASQIANSLLGIFTSTNGSASFAETPSNVKPMVSVSAVETSVNEGSSVEFNIVSRGTIDQALAVQFDIDQIGDFIGEQTPSQIQLSQEQNSSLVVIDTIDDTLAEEDGQVSLALIASNTYQIGEPARATVIISDQADRLRRSEAISAAGQEVLSELVGSIGARSISTTTNRVRNAFSATGPTTQFELNGADQITDLLTAGGELINGDTMSMRSILGNSSFTIDLFPEAEFTSPATIWGLGDHRDLKSSSRTSANSWNGDVFTGQIGFDAKVGQNILAGLSASVVESDVKHEGAIENGLTFRTNSTALNAYFGWKSANQATQLRGVAGYGLGDITLEQRNYAPELLTSQFYTVGLSGDHQLYASEGIFGDGATELRINGESWLASQFVSGIPGKINEMDVAGSHYRVITIGSHLINLESGGSLKPRVSIGMRRDQKNQDSIYGLELGSGISYSHASGLSLTGNSNALVVDYDEIQKWSVIGNLTYDHGGDNLGTLFELTPSIGRTLNSNSNTLWNSNILDELSELGRYMDGVGIDSELGYGIAVFNESGVFTPFGGIDVTNGEVAEYQIGTRMLIGSGLKFELESSQQFSIEGDTQQEFKLTGGISW